MSQILGGVEAAHSKGIAHCDLSPRNIILATDDRPKVMDFGLSTLLTEPLGQNGSVAGTPAYMSPEHLGGQVLGFQSDIFALGAIFFEMMTGEKHFPQTSRRELFEAIIRGETRSVSALDDEIPPLIDRIVGTALMRDRVKRYPAASAMKRELDKYRIPRSNASDVQHSTVNFLLRRLRHAPGFSAFSDRIQHVLRITGADRGSDAKKLANILVRDVTLSRRVLTMANSALNPGAEITTLSRAIAWLGMDQVRHCVTTCLLTRSSKRKPRISSSFRSQAFSARC